MEVTLKENPMLFRNRKVRSNDRESVHVHVSPRGELRVSADEVFATESVQKLVEQVSKIRTEYTVRKRIQDKSASDQPGNQHL